MSLKHLAEEIKKLSPKQRQELFRKAGLEVTTTKSKRGGPDDPFFRLIGKINGPGTGSKNYKKDLYGKKNPL